MRRRLTVLHYLVQWLWTSDSFVYGPIKRSRHEGIVLSHDPVINHSLYPHDRIIGPDDWGQSGSIADVLAPLGVELVHVHHGYGLGEGAALAAGLGVPLVCSFWGYDVTALPAASPGYYSDALDSITTAIVPSNYLASVVIRLGVPPNRIAVVPGSVDTKFFTPTPVPTARRVVFVGRFVEKKGIPLLLGVWDEVYREVPGAELHLLGYGDDGPRADRRRNVHVHIATPQRGRRQVRDLIVASRVYVSPSLRASDGDAESQHIGNLEAQASGRPVVTTRHGGIPEFVEHLQTGIVVSENDPEALRAALVGLLTDHPRCVRLGAAGRAHCLQFDVQPIADRLDDIYALVSRA